ncbi:uncharacterized protein TNCT_576551, partial [Trichonephila clavata]
CSFENNSMESALLLSLVVSLMFAGGNGYSQSMSCSTVNGRTICENQSGSGNYAGSASMAGFGPGGSMQDAGAMVGDSYSGTSSLSRTQVGNMPAGGFGGMPGMFGDDDKYGANSEVESSMLSRNPCCSLLIRKK